MRMDDFLRILDDFECEVEDGLSRVEYLKARKEYLENAERDYYRYLEEREIYGDDEPSPETYYGWAQQDLIDLRRYER